MSSSEIPPGEPQSTILFRPSKKRKIASYRQRASTPEEPTSTAIATNASPPQSLDELIASTAGDAQVEVEGAEVPISEILRLRKLARKGKGGVEFRAEGSQSKETEQSKALVRRGSNDHEESEMQEQGGLGVVRRFAAQTGTVGDVNRHMMAYIDSELAKRNASSSSIQSSTKPPSTTLPTRSPNTETGNENGDGMVPKKDPDVNRQPATLGKLMEIDLGPSARETNEQLTDRAKRRLEGEDLPDESITKKPAKVRLGRDGKPFRSKRKRRNSDDIARDKLVEDVLRDNRLEIFEPLPEEEVRNGTGNDEAADDRIAEAFRREFMDAVGARQQRKKQVGPPVTGGKKGEEELKGPKLGGSRSARAAMREVMLKEQAGKK
ncbi:hypothetical protein B0J14DRAFT_629722 [Halenospora varia]|nr:hypothetical protein B0J14DRAFT_629722 [Halenospora varia]